MKLRCGKRDVPCRDEEKEATPLFSLKQMVNDDDDIGMISLRDYYLLILPRRHEIRETKSSLTTFY